jgi:hypothetical protein
MKLHDVLYSTAFITGILGYAGMGGVIEHGTGLMTCVALFVICAISAVWGMHEDGKFRKEK